MDQLPLAPASPNTATVGQHWQQPNFARPVERTVYGDHGYESVRAWSAAPATEANVAAARQWLAESAALTGPASLDSVRRWLIALALQTAGKGMTAADAEARASAYVPTLADEPAFCFTAATLKAAARKFTWFPSVAEIVELLERETADKRSQVDIAKRLASQIPRRVDERPAGPARSVDERIADVVAARRAFGLRDDQSLRNIIDAPPRPRATEPLKAMCLWIDADGKTVMGPDCPPGGMSLRAWREQQEVAA